MELNIKNKFERIDELTAKAKALDVQFKSVCRILTLSTLKTFTNYKGVTKRYLNTFKYSIDLDENNNEETLNEFFSSMSMETFYKQDKLMLVEDKYSSVGRVFLDPFNLLFDTTYLTGHGDYTENFINKNQDLNSNFEYYSAIAASIRMAKDFSGSKFSQLYLDYFNCKQEIEQLEREILILVKDSLSS